MGKAEKLSTRVYYIFVVFSLFAAIECGSNDGINNKGLYLLPLTYGLTLLICQKLRTLFLSLSVIIINSVCLIRYAVYPLSLMAEKSVYYTTESVYLMVYEIIVVLLFLNFYSVRIKNAKKIERESFKCNDLGKLNFLLILLTLLLGVAFPSLFSLFIYYGGEKQDLSGVISMTFSLGTMVVYIFLLSKISNWRGGGGLALLFSVIVAISYIFLTSVGETNVHRWKFLSVGIPTIYVLVASFPKYRLRIVSFSLLVIPLSVFLGSFVKFAVSDISIESFATLFLTSNSFSEYFGGLNGITNALALLRGNINAESFTSTLTDFFGNMPVVSRFFNTDLYSTEALYLDALGRRDLICPLLVQSVLHFGVVGAPVMSIIMTIISVESDRYSRVTKSVYSLYGSIMLCVTFSLFMCLNTTIMLPNLWKLLLFLIIQYFNKKYFINGKTVNSSSRIQYS